MRYSQKWWVIVALLFAFTLTVSVLTAQTEEPSAVNTPSSAKVQTDSVGAQASSDEPEQKQPTLEPNRDTASADVENERRFNELRRELLDDQAKTLDWWLAATAIFLTFLAIVIPIAAFIGGRFSFKKFNEIKDEAQRYVEEIKTRRDEADSLVKGMNAEVVGDDPDKASEVVENIQQNPDSSPIDRAVAAALSLQQQNRDEEAIEKWRSIANIVEETDSELAARAWFSVGYLALLEKLDRKMALDAYDKALRLNPDLVEAYYNRGMVKIVLGQWEAALADYDAAIARNPNYAQAYYSRGMVKETLGQREAALVEYDAAIARNPDYTQAYYNRGVVKEALGQLEAAIADFDAAIAQKPDYTQAYYRRGVAKEALGQLEAALADYDEAIRLYPDNTDAYFSRGNAKAQQERIDEARQDLEKALNLAQATGNADLAAKAAQDLSNLDRGDAP
ncbi:MAG: tetratricopeptide repeat protein [Gemmatimonadota bacterium]|nr:tetratricopeptide repeat protein [Gemmatimonadota bacterium]